MSASARPVILYIATSADGFIARPDGDTSWLHAPELEIEGEDYGYYKMYERIDSVLMGRKTMDIVDGFDVPYPYPDKQGYVFSRSAHPPREEFEWVQEDVVEWVRRMKNEPGKAMWLVGGAELFRQLDAVGLVDEIVWTVVPVKLGEGIALFEGDPLADHYTLQDTQTYPNGVKIYSYTLS